MPFDPQAGRADTNPETGDSRRRTGRVTQENLESNVGTVLDLSATGMRALTRGVRKGRFPVTLEGIGQKITVMGEVVWSRRVGLLRREVGIKFQDVPPRATEILTRMAMTNRYRRAM